ncbi:MAG: bifunctional serine/threonine-protein kinase/formylglycine-generating enzyme family protein [Planctomycetota bacterium]
MGLVDGGTRPFVDRLGEYRLLRVLGHGGMGMVFLGQQPSLRRLVAIKVLHPYLAGDARMSARFRREAEAVAKLRHPHIVTVFGTGEDAGHLYTVMEFVPGRGLDDILQKERPDRRDVLRWVRDLAGALHCAHLAGVLHRDVKPSNVRIADDGRAMLLDFGLARDASAPALTITGAFHGSPQYASPEQVAPDGAEIGPATDVYSLGVTLFEAVSGQPPFPGETTEQLFHDILHREPLRPRTLDARIPRDLETVILTAIERRPERRYPSAAAFAADLDALLELRPIAARPPGPVARARSWMRRHRVAAAALGVTAAALATGLAVRTATSARAAAAAGAVARDHLATARRQLAAWTEARQQAVRLAADIADVEQDTTYRSADVWRAIEATVARLRATRRLLSADFVTILKALDLAEEHAPSRPQARGLRASAYFERYRYAVACGDDDVAVFAATMAESNDDLGRYREALHPTFPLELTVEPAGARVWLLRYVELEREPRLVPVPAFGEPSTALAPGSWCLRVTHSAGEVEATDLIFEVAGQPIAGTVFALADHGAVGRGDRLVAVDGRPVHSMFDADRASWPPGESAGRLRRFSFRSGPASVREAATVDVDAASLAEIGLPIGDACALATLGGVRARLYRVGTVLDVALPVGLGLRTTAAPFLLTDGCRVDLDRPPPRLERGSYVVVADHPGHESVRLPIDCPPATSRPRGWTSLRLLPHGTSPSGFARIGSLSIWMQDHEVTCGDYLDYLNDPDTQAEIDRGGRPMRYPRDLDTAMSGGYFARDPESRRFSLRAPWTPDMPVLGVSWEDANAYARWRSDQAAHHGSPWRYELPSWGDYCAARRFGREYPSRQFAYGAVFRPHWSKSCNARLYPCVEPVLRYPIDESPCGIFDLTGSASEWAADVWSRERGERWLIGASWANAQPFRFHMVTGAGERAVSETFGFRLLARRSD